MQFKSSEEGLSRETCRFTCAYNYVNVYVSMGVILFKLTFKDRAYFPNCSCSFSVVLTQSKFHVEQWHPRNEQEKKVGDQKGTWRGKNKSHFNFILKVHFRLVYANVT